jgi:hypothetical protein
MASTGSCLDGLGAIVNEIIGVLVLTGRVAFRPTGMAERMNVST